MIQLQHITKRFSTIQHGKAVSFTALDDISLHIRAGEIFGLMGYSGAGKSTLLRMINLLERPDTGSVIVDGKELTKLSTSQLRYSRHNIGMVFQQFNLMANRTVFDNIAFNLKICNYPPNQIKERVMACLEIVSLTDRAHHYPAELSGGQKQRVGIARAIAPSPKVLLADEPTSALDPDTTRSLLACLDDINRKLGVTIVIVTHEMNVIKRLCHRTALLHHGQLLEIANIHEHTIQATTEVGKRLISEQY